MWADVRAWGVPMRTTTMAAVLVLATAGMAGPARADDPCGSGDGVYRSVGHRSMVIVVGDGGDGTVYVDDRDVTGNGVWIYQESNGQSGLQRGGSAGGDGTYLGVVDPCAESSTPDTLVL